MKTAPEYVTDAIRLSELPHRLTMYGVPFDEQRRLLIAHWKSIAEKAVELALSEAASVNGLPELGEADIPRIKTEEEYDNHPDFLGREHGH